MTRVTIYKYKIHQNIMVYLISHCGLSMSKKKKKGDENSCN